MAGRQGRDSAGWSVARWQPQCCTRKSAALGASLGVGPAPPVVCQAEPATPLPSPFLRGTASPCSYLPAIPPGLVSFPPCARSSLCCGLCSSPKPQSLPGRQDTAVRIRSRLLPQTAPVRPHQGCGRLSLIQRHCQGANHRRTPLQPPFLAPTGWAVPA